MLEEILRDLHSELPPNVELVAVSKFHPSSMIRRAYQSGQRVFAESRPQELQRKLKELEDLKDIKWHFIGHLQTNKLKMVLPYADLIQSVDSFKLLQAINNWGLQNGKRINILLEVHIATEESKQGFAEDEIYRIISSYASSRDKCAVEICGLMGMASNTEDESLICSDFSRLQNIYNNIKSRHPELSSFKELSIGMSGDYTLAVRYGSTMVRIGTMIFGDRN